MAAGLDRIRAELEIPESFPPDVTAAAADAARRPHGGSDRVDRTSIAYVTLDPASATDLDQAFAIEHAGDDVLLHYAIADVGSFVHHGDAVDAEAWRRGVTVYLPDRRTPLYPESIGEGAASLLPDVERPAVVFTVRIASDGAVVLAGVERALVRSVAKLAYETVQPDDLPDGFAEIGRRITAAEEARGAPRVLFPEQQLARSDSGYELRFRPRLPSEEHNAALSLATNLAVADALHAAGTGLFRVLPEVDARQQRELRGAAKAFGLPWPADVTLDAFERSLDHDDPRSSAFLLAVRRSAGGASYVPFHAEIRPWHSAIAATYAHATAPLRRLQDRYVVELALAVADGRPVTEPVASVLAELPAAMAAGEQRANRAERLALDLAEAVLLEGREGEVFDAVVTDVDDRALRIQICDPAIVARVTPGDGVAAAPGDELQVRLVEADAAERTVRFELSASSGV